MAAPLFGGVAYDQGECGQHNGHRRTRQRRWSLQRRGGDGRCLGGLGVRASTGVGGVGGEGSAGSVVITSATGSSPSFVNLGTLSIPANACTVMAPPKARAAGAAGLEIAPSPPRHQSACGYDSVPRLTKLGLLPVADVMTTLPALPSPPTPPTPVLALTPNPPKASTVATTPL